MRCDCPHPPPFVELSTFPNLILVIVSGVGVSYLWVSNEERVYLALAVQLIQVLCDFPQLFSACQGGGGVSVPLALLCKMHTSNWSCTCMLYSHVLCGLIVDLVVRSIVFRMDL